VGDEKFITKVCGTLGVFFSLGRGGGEGRGEEGIFNNNNNKGLWDLWK